MAGKAPVFDPIIRWYDTLNSVFSFGIDRHWRMLCARKAAAANGHLFVDIASGTGKMVHALKQALHHRSIIVGVDPSRAMIEWGIKKMRYETCTETRVFAVQGIAEKIPLASHSASAVTCAFGMRNFTHLRGGLQEIYRILRPCGIFSAVEITYPHRIFTKVFFGPYFKYFMPLAGNFLSQSRSYTYLRNSVMNFPSREALTGILKEVGFRKADYQELTGGIACLYFAIK